ncbi:MAG: C40 family peptidase [Bacteroidota bacterium]
MKLLLNIHTWRYIIALLIFDLIYSSTISRDISFVSYTKDTCIHCQSHILSPEQPASTDTYSTISIKYSLILDTTIESISNFSLYHFIDQWMGVPYQYGGNDKNGIDCSSFSGLLYQQIYGYTLPRSSLEQSAHLKVVNESELKEGDLMFFRTNRNQISHVGIYLGNRRFVHASTLKGVTIDSLDHSYYQKRFVSAGRIP